RGTGCGNHAVPRYWYRNFSSVIHRKSPQLAPATLCASSGFRGSPLGVRPILAPPLLGNRFALSGTRLSNVEPQPFAFQSTFVEHFAPVRHGVDYRSQAFA